MSSGGHHRSVTHYRSASAGPGATIHRVSPKQTLSPHEFSDGGHAMTQELIAEIKETHRMRTDLHRAEKRLTLQIKAIHRRMGAKGKVPSNRDLPSSDGGGDHRPSDTHEMRVPATIPLELGREPIKKERLARERILRKLAMNLDVADWMESVPGFGPLGLAQIIGEAGDLSNYPNPGKLWKRMCLALVNGTIQRRIKGSKALEHGYSPERRSVMWNIGESLIKKSGHYRDVYLERKELEKQRSESGECADRAAEMLKNGSHSESQRKVLESGKLPKGMLHNRARRYTEKRLLRDLWQAWRQ